MTQAGRLRTEGDTEVALEACSPGENRTEAGDNQPERSWGDSWPTRWVQERGWEHEALGHAHPATAEIGNYHLVGMKQQESGESTRYIGKGVGLAAGHTLDDQRCSCSRHRGLASEILRPE